MNHTYPLRPDHISNDGSKSQATPLTSLTGIGIIPNEYLKGILTEIASALKNPNTVVEFPPDPSIPPVRTDAVSLHFDLHPPCRVFRDRTDAFYCHRCDDLHASLFRGLIKNNLGDSLQEKINSTVYREEYEHRYGKEPLTKISRSKDGKEDSVYLEYDCPILGYRELLFPILFENRLVGVMFLGELVLASQKEFISERRNHFFELYNNDLKQFPKYKDTLLAKIESADNQYRKSRKNVYTDDQYSTLITDTQSKIERMVSRLTEAMEITRKEFISTKMDFYIKQLRIEISRGFPISDKGFLSLWNKVEVILGQLNRDFPTKHIVIFGTKKYLSASPRTLEVVASVGIDERKRKTLQYDLQKISSSILNEVATSADIKKLFDGLEKENLVIEEDFVRVFPSTLLPQCTFVVWIRHNRQVWDRLATPGTQSDRAFDDAIQSLYTIIAATYTSIWAFTAQYLMESVLKVFGHEMGQITPGLDAIRKLYISPPHKITSLPNDKIKDIDDDTNGLLSQLHFIGEKAKQLITGSLEVSKEEFWAYNKLLFKWQNTFKASTEGKRLKIIVQKTWLDDPMRPMVNGDVLLLEQLVYNLLSNAIKYAHRGTNIILDCAINENDRSKHVLTVTNYGIDIGENAKIFELYQRGENIEGIQGLGIGLFLAQKVAQAHGGDIDFKREKISDYNIPLIQKYLTLESDEEARSFQWNKDESLKSSLISALDNLKQSGSYDEIISKQANQSLFYLPSIQETIKSIFKPTYKVTLLATIPRKE